MRYSSDCRFACRGVIGHVTSCPIRFIRKWVRPARDSGHDWPTFKGVEFAIRFSLRPPTRPYFLRLFREISEIYLNGTLGTHELPSDSSFVHDYAMLCPQNPTKMRQNVMLSLSNKSKEPLHNQSFYSISISSCEEQMLTHTHLGVL